MKLPVLGLRSRLLALILFIVLPAFGLCTYTVIQQREGAQQSAIEAALNVVRLATQEQSRLISTSKQLLVALSLLSETKNPKSATACNRITGDMVLSYPFYTSIGVATLDGNIWCSSRPLTKKTNIGDRVYFKRTLESQDFSVGTYIFGRVSGVHALNMGYPVMNGDKLTGVMYVGINLNWVGKMISTIRLPKDSVVMIIDDLDTLLARYPEGDASAIGKKMPSSALLLAMRKNRGEGTTEVVGEDGVSRFFAFAPLQDTPGGNVHVIVGISKNVVFAEADKQFVRNIVLELLVAVLAIIVALVGSNAFVLKRLRALSAAAKRFGGGDMTARTGLEHGQEEIGRLAQSFDHMASGLELMAHALLRVNRGLKTLGACSRVIAQSQTEAQLVSEICRIIPRIGGYKFAWIGYVELGESKNIFPVAESWRGDGLDNTVVPATESSWSSDNQGVAAQSVRSTKPYVIQRCQTDGPEAVRDEAGRCGYASVAAYPIVINSVVVAVVVIYSDEPTSFSGEEFELLSENAQDVALGIAAIRARNEHDRALEKMAYFDSLTGLPNRHRFERIVHSALGDVANRDDLLALMVIDVNRMWEVNDALGFQAGDDILREVASRLRKLFRPEDDATIARMRGDEFAILMRSTNQGTIEETAKMMLRALNEPFHVANMRLDISAVVGISLAPMHGTETGQILRHADVAMHQAKKSGNGYAFYIAADDTDNTERLAMVAELRHAIENNELVLFYQPKVDMRTGSVCGAEALVRWNHPVRGMIYPDSFIPLAEQTWLIKPLTEWVVEEALRQAVIWRKAGWSFPIAVNLSARNLHDPVLVDKIARAVADAGAQPNWIELEITEGAVMEDPDGALETLQRLSEMGIVLYIDDFGTGYSSLGYLSKLPVEAMKIDKSFVLSMLKHGGSAAIVRSTIGLAHDLSLKVVAEGVESQEMWSELEVLGCDVAQGYFISKPLPANMFIERILSTSATKQAK